MQNEVGPMGVTWIHVSHKHFKKGCTRILGEVDLFLLSELPVQKLLDLQSCPTDNFLNTFKDILIEIGQNWVHRLANNPLYTLNHYKTASKALSEREAIAFAVDQAFMYPISEVWDDVAVDDNVMRRLRRLLKKQLTDQKENVMCYLYAILVYARSILKQKGGQWHRFYPRM